MSTLLGEDAWQPRGIVVLGTAAGDEHFTREKLQNRIDDERRLCETIPNVPDWQCVCKSCCSVRAPKPTTLPPISLVCGHHDDGIWNVARTLCGDTPGTEEAVEGAETLASRPIRMEGLGFSSAERCAHAVYWASWADALHMTAQRNFAVAEAAVESTSNEINPGGESLAEFQMARPPVT